MIKDDINKLKRILSFRLRKKIKKKIVIIESDDWGMERAKDEASLNKIKQKYGKEKISRWTTDALETVDDMNIIFDLFDNYKNKFMQKPILTANFITHNIDYSSTQKLAFKPISEGFNFVNNEIFDKYKEGIEKKYFKPQLHGYSHFDTKLLEEDFVTQNFQDDLNCGFATARSTIKGHLSLYRAECFDTNFAINFKIASEIFHKTFGYYSQTFIPPNYMYSDKWNKFLHKIHIETLQSASHFLDKSGNNSLVPYFRFKNKIIHSARNARLDPHQDYNYLSENCINQIESAFLYEMPAIIDIHRVNFSGKYLPQIRQKTIEELDKVLSYLYKNHPEIIFISSDELIHEF